MSHGSGDDSSRSKSRGRPPRGAGLLSIDRIVEATLDEIAEEGLASLSARSVARRLGVDSKSIYNYVDGKDGLLTAVADHVMATFVVPGSTGELEVDLPAFAHAFRAHTMKHPQAAILVMTRPTQSAASLIPLNAALAILFDAGFDAARAVRQLRMIMAMLIGSILREAEAGLTFGTSNERVMSERQHDLDGSDLPAIQRAASNLVAINHDAEFQFALDRLVGIVQSEGAIAR